MHDQRIIARNQQRLPPQPPKQAIHIGRTQQIIERIRGMSTRRTVAAGQQMQIMITEHRRDMDALAHCPAQHLKRLRPAINEVAKQIQAVPAWLIPDLSQQGLKFVKNIPGRRRLHNMP